jgi:hypothetical protein
MERRVEVFFYGLFMDADVLRDKGFHPADARRASVADMALHLGERATLVPERGSRVHGMLMSLTHAELDRLYAEPSVAAYRPEPVLASLADGRIVAALCFNLPAVPAGVRSNPEYAAKLRIAAKKMGLPEN